LFGIITITTSIEGYGNGDDGSVGLSRLDKAGKDATSVLRSVIGASQRRPVMRDAKNGDLLMLMALEPSWRDALRGSVRMIRMRSRTSGTFAMTRL
jgi:hypothetical protein